MIFPLQRILIYLVCFLVGCVIVTYNGEDIWQECLQSIIHQVDQIIIVDNASSDKTKSQLTELIQDEKTEVILNKENLGIGAALNIGLKKLLSNTEINWILTLDQDSKCPKDFLSSLLDQSKQTPNNVGILAPIHDGKISHIAKKSNNKSNLTSLETVITSGSLTNRKAFDQLGYFNESLFIDSVDHEFCLRLRKNNFLILQNEQVYLEHQIGNPLKVKLGPIVLCTLTNHPDQRYYYMYRNVFYLIRKFNSPWISSHLWALCKIFIKTILFDRARKSKLKMIILGLHHGYKGKYGKLVN